MSRRIYKLNPKIVKRCSFCGYRPENVWVTKKTDTLYKCDLMHDCRANISMHISRFDDSPETVIGCVLDVWNGMED